MTLGDTKEDSKKKGKKKGFKHDKRKGKSGAKGKQGSDVPVAGEIDTRLLSALLTVSWSILQSCFVLVDGCLEYSISFVFYAII